MDAFADLPESIVSDELNFESGFSSFLNRSLQIAMSLMMVTADSFAILSSIVLTVYIVNFVGLHQNLKVVDLALISMIFIAMHALWGLYSTASANPVEELRNLSLSSTTTFLSLAVFDIWLGNNQIHALVFALLWVFSLVLLPLGRSVARSVGIRVGLWGEPVAIFGYGSLGKGIARFLKQNPQFGLRPIIAIDDSDDLEETVDPLPVLSVNQWFHDSMGPITKAIHTAILVTSEIPPSLSESTEWIQKLGIPRVVTVPGESKARNRGLKMVDLGGILALEERNTGQVVRDNFIIRAMDLGLIILSLPFIVPIFLLLALSIRIDSKGGVFYRQCRIGREGRMFEVLKFRTMVTNADQVLPKFLDENPEARVEWETTQKLKNDPRITLVGKVLRKLSLDELPQLWNVVKGEMSLVGPRPIVSDEIEKYGDKFQFYTQVSPGLTGMWQVSGRNDISYKDRVRLDQFYVRNRSIWLNIYLLARTVTVVLRGSGAY